MGKQRALLAADAAADFHNDALVVVRVARQQQNFELLLERFQLFLAGGVFLLTKLLQLRVQTARIQHAAQVLCFLLCFAVAAIGSDNRLEALLFAQEL